MNEINLKKNENTENNWHTEKKKQWMNTVFK